MFIAVGPFYYSFEVLDIYDGSWIRGPFTIDYYYLLVEYLSFLLRYVIICSAGSLILIVRWPLISMIFLGCYSYLSLGITHPLPINTFFNF